MFILFLFVCFSAQFLRNFEIFTKNQLGEGFNWSNVLMIGGGVGACLFPAPEEFKGGTKHCCLILTVRLLFFSLSSSLSTHCHSHSHSHSLTHLCLLFTQRMNALGKEEDYYLNGPWASSDIDLCLYGLKGKKEVCCYCCSLFVRRY